jgi:hypothetical protein
VGITGKYNFTGIQKAGVAAIDAALAGTTWGASIVASVFFKPIENWFLEFAINWLANKGLIVLNLGAIVVNGEVDQALFDNAMDAGLKRVEQGRDQITEAEGLNIDQEVILAARRFIPGSPN